MSLECRVESDDLPPQTRSELEVWVKHAPAGGIVTDGVVSSDVVGSDVVGNGARRGVHSNAVPGMPGVDLFRYELEIDRGDRHLTYIFDDATLPEPLLPLIDYLCDHLQPGSSRGPGTDSRG